MAKSTSNALLLVKTGAALEIDCASRTSAKISELINAAAPEQSLKLICPNARTENLMVLIKLAQGKNITFVI